MVRCLHALVNAMFGKVKIGGVGKKFRPSIFDEEFRLVKLTQNFLANERLYVVTGLLGNGLCYSPPGDILNRGDD